MGGKEDGTSCCGGRGAESLPSGVVEVSVVVVGEDDGEDTLTEGPTPISTPSTGIPNTSTIDTFNTVSILAEEDDGDDVGLALLLFRLTALMYLSFRSEKVSMLPERETSSVT